jgi:2'-5' RNA ligase
VKGIGNFDKKVVFAEIEKNSALDEIAEICRESFKTEFPTNFDTKPFHPHLTIYKPQRQNKFQKPVIQYFEAVKDLDFGVQKIESLQLCAMEKPVMENGFYHIDHQGKM